jgi:hypothetical protein
MNKITPLIRQSSFLVTAALLALGLAVGTPLAGQSTQHAFGVGGQFQAYSFDEGLGAEVANLLLVPMAYSVPVGERVGLDFYGAYAFGAVEKAGVTYELNGFVDTRVRATLRMTPWAVLTASVTAPTGHATHNDEEAVVASVLSTDILGFREANWGTGAAVTTGMAAATQAGEWGIGLGGSYRYSNGFEPTEGVEKTYIPGNEIRVRFGVDRNIGEGGKFTAGFTFQNYSEDEYDDRNLFQAGNRLRGDMSVIFRAGRSTWALSGVNVYRDQGDAFLDLVDAQNNVVGDTTVVVGWQNLSVVGLSGSVPLGSTFRIRPAFDFRYQSRETEGGEGWLAGAGADIPLRLFGTMDVFPRGKFSFGKLTAPTGESLSLWGVEAGLTLRWRL